MYICVNLYSQNLSLVAKRKRHKPAYSKAQYGQLLCYSLLKCNKLNRQHQNINLVSVAEQVWLNLSRAFAMPKTYIFTTRPITHAFYYMLFFIV